VPAIFRTSWWASIGIAAARRVFRNTPLQRFSIVTRVYRFMFARVHPPHQDITIDYLGLRFVVPSDDITIVPSLAAGDYEREEFAALELAIQPGMTVVDVGVHAAFFGSRVGSQGMVCAFEPEPTNHARLVANVAANGLVNIHVQEGGRRPRRFSAPSPGGWQHRHALGVTERRIVVR
jgi:hypothetical protein